MGRGLIRSVFVFAALATASACGSSDHASVTGSTAGDDAGVTPGLGCASDADCRAPRTCIAARCRDPQVPPTATATGASGGLPVIPAAGGQPTLTGGANATGGVTADAGTLGGGGSGGVATGGSTSAGGAGQGGAGGIGGTGVGGAPPAPCFDGTRNGSESDVDCGGSCAPCGQGERCTSAPDCLSEVCSCNNAFCTSRACAAPQCDDGVQNGDEPSTDCGGSCPTPCAVGEGCAIDDDCDRGPCQAGVCGCTPLTAATCQAGQCGAHNDTCSGTIDCGACATGSTCVSGSCCPLTFETSDCRADIDCGAIADGCGTTVDCGACSGGEVCGGRGPNLCGPAGGCFDGVRNNAETAVDCGGSLCAPCATGASCSRGADCESRVCACTGVFCTSRCVAATCSDGVKNGDETDVDCGGSCTARCPPNATCEVNADCSRGPCVSGVCGCTALTAAECTASVDCGTFDDTCGDVYDCGACASGYTCRSGACCELQFTITDCRPGTDCGNFNNGCGGVVQCGGCDIGYVCGAGGVNLCGLPNYVRCASPTNCPSAVPCTAFSSGFSSVSVCTPSCTVPGDCPLGPGGTAPSCDGSGRCIFGCTSAANCPSGMSCSGSGLSSGVCYVP